MTKKTALVTGGGRGIGRAIVERLANDGFQVVIHFHKSKKQALELAAILKKKKINHMLIEADISRELDVKKMMSSVRKRFSSIDVLVNNAGIIQTESLSRLQFNHFDQVLNTNVRGSLLVTKYALPLIRKSPAGKIIFIISSSAYVGSGTQFSYVVSKAGLVGAVRALALECALHNILVNGIVPGYVDTDMARKVSKDMKKGIQKIPMGRIGRPEEIAALAAFLASNDNTFITGQCIHINGGRYMA